MAGSHFYKDLQLPPPPVERPYIAINMISSLDGKVTVGGDLKPGSLGGAFDRHTMNVIRSNFDAVLVGGNTLRRHPFYLGVPPELERQRLKRGLTAQPLTICLTKSGQLDPNSPLFQDPPRPPLVFTSAQGASALDPKIKRVSNVEIIADRQDTRAIAKILAADYRIKHLLVEGGPSINYQFLRAAITDELFLTLAPKLVGAKADFTMAMGEEPLLQPKHVALLSAHEHENELFLRYELVWQSEVSKEE